ncbi:unnamed protein product [Closterium sp. NIES-64]|nr:unnamed protein product [Closterium sp. NIES-64]
MRITSRPYRPQAASHRFADSRSPSSASLPSSASAGPSPAPRPNTGARATAAGGAACAPGRSAQARAPAQDLGSATRAPAGPHLRHDRALEREFAQQLRNLPPELPPASQPDVGLPEAPPSDGACGGGAPGRSGLCSPNGGGYAAPPIALAVTGSVGRNDGRRSASPCGEPRNLRSRWNGWRILRGGSTSLRPSARGPKSFRRPRAPSPLLPRISLSQRPALPEAWPNHGADRRSWCRPWAAEGWRNRVRPWGGLAEASCAWVVPAAGLGDRECAECNPRSICARIIRSCGSASGFPNNAACSPMASHAPTDVPAVPERSGNECAAVEADPRNKSHRATCLPISGEAIQTHVASFWLNVLEHLEFLGEVSSAFLGETVPGGRNRRELGEEWSGTQAGSSISGQPYSLPPGQGTTAKNRTETGRPYLRVRSTLSGQLSGIDTCRKGTGHSPASILDSPVPSDDSGCDSRPELMWGQPTLLLGY